MDVSCPRFLANMFDQTRCQNCFKSRQLHLETHVESEQVKPIYASWLCLAPEGLDFDNPMQRSRKWQRRFFVLYEHGCLEFALDDLPSTIPQGTVNLHHCSDVTEAEDRTGLKNTLCIITPDKEIYIRGDSKEIISGWCEQLLLFSQTNKQKQRKTERRSSVPLQEETCTSKSVCNIGAANTGAVEDGDLCTAGEEDDPYENTEDINIGQDVKVTTADAASLGSDNWAKEGTGKLRTLEIKQETSSVDTHQAKGGSVLYLPFQHHSTFFDSPETRRTAIHDLSPCDLPSDSLCWQGEDAESCAKHPKASSVAKHLTQDEENTEELQARTLQNKNNKDSCFIKSSMAREDCWTNENEKQCKMRTQSSSSSRRHTGCIRNMEKSVGLMEATQSNSSTVMRLQTMQVKISESTMTPDLLNFKKGWLFMDDRDQRRRYWFVLSAHSLRYYFDSGAEEASQLMGEIDLTTCHRVTELQELENFGFEIWTSRMVYKLATETAGMQQNWIQALTKNIQDQNAPDVASIPDNWLSRLGPQSGPDVTQESMSVSCPVTKDCFREQRPLHYRKQHGHPKTSSWTDVLTQQGLTREEEKVEQNAEGKINRRRGREERRQKYAVVMGSSESPLDEKHSRTEKNQKQERIGEIEQCWLQVEMMAIREEKRVPLYPVGQSEDCVELNKLLKHYRNRLEKVIIQSESTNQDNSQDHGHGTDWSLLELMCDLGTERESQKMGPNERNTSLTARYQYTPGLVNLEDLRRRQINDLLDLYPSSQSSIEVTNEPKRRSELNLLHEGITSDKPIKSLRSLALCQASRNLGDDPSWARIFSKRTLQVINKDTNSYQAMLKLSQEAKFLIRQHETLNQQNQELLNQLAEADREINRLKAKLFYQPHGHQPELETIVECLKLELAWRCSELQAATTQLAEMEDNLKDTQQLKEAVLKSLGMERENKNAFPEIIDRLRQCVQVLEFKVSKLLSQQRFSTLTCTDPQTQNNLLVKLEVENGQKVIEDDKKNKVMQTELESNFLFCDALTHIKDQQHQNKTKIVEQLKKRFRFLKEIVNQLAGNEMTDSVSRHEAVQMNPRVFRRLQLETDIWESFLNTLKNTASNNMENEEMARVLQIAEMKLEEVKMYLSALCIYEGTSSNPVAPRSNSGPNSSDNTASTNLDIVGTNDGKTVAKQIDVMWKCLKEHMDQRMILIDHVTSKLKTFTNNEHFFELMKQSYIWNKTNTFYPMISVVMDIMAGYLVEKLSQPVQKSVAIQTENQEMMLKQNNVAVNEKTEVSEGGGKETIPSLNNHIKELEDLLSERLTSPKQQFDEDKETLKAAFKQEITLLKESHRKATEVFVLKHQREQDLLQEEKERLLTEEVAACLTVIKAMERAHRSELEKMQQKALQERTDNGHVNIEVILKNHSEALSAVQKELDALSEQYTQKCLENLHLAEALQEKRETLQQYQCQNQAFNIYNQELTNHLAKEIRRLSTVAKDDCSQLVHDREEYERLIMLQVKESCRAQEIDLLKIELCAAKMDQKVATERVHEMQTELNSVKRTTEQQITQLKENLRLVYGALEESIKKILPTTPLAASSLPALC